MEKTDKVKALRRDAFVHLVIAGATKDKEVAQREIDRYFELIDEAEDIRTGRKTA